MRGVFRYVLQSGGQVRKLAICNECTNSYTVGINTLSIQLYNVWIHLALGKIVHCENIATYIKSHLNSKYAVNFFLKSLQEMKQKLYLKI